MKNVSILFLFDILGSLNKIITFSAMAYESQLTRDDLKNVNKSTVRWKQSDGVIFATSFWPAKLFYHASSPVTEIMPIFSPTFSAGNDQELKYEIQLEYRGGYCYLKLHFFDLHNLKYNFQASILNNQLQEIEFKKFDMSSTSSSTSNEITFFLGSYNSHLREGKTTILIIVGMIAELPMTIKTEIKEEVEDEYEEKDIKPDIKPELIPKELQDFETLLLNELFADLRLVVGDEKLPAHRNILAVRSPVFLEIFTSSKHEHILEIEISDVDNDAIREMLRFMYTGHTDYLEENMARKLLVLANKYQIKALAAKCEDTLCCCLTLRNVIDFLKLADNVQAEELKSKAIKVLINNIDEVEEADLSTLKAELLTKVLLGVTKRGRN